jgi:molecular chaperone DnaK (HSP70)
VHLNSILQVVGPLEQVLKDAEMSKSEVNKILLVGGSTRIPKVRNRNRNRNMRQYYGDKRPSQVAPLSGSVCSGSWVPKR